MDPVLQARKVGVWATHLADAGWIGLGPAQVQRLSTLDWSPAMQHRPLWAVIGRQGKLKSDSLAPVTLAADVPDLDDHEGAIAKCLINRIDPIYLHDGHPYFLKGEGLKVAIRAEDLEGFSRSLALPTPQAFCDLLALTSAATPAYLVSLFFVRLPEAWAAKESLAA